MKPGGRAGKETRLTQYRHPGVYVTELPGPQTFRMATSHIAAFVGRTKSGPIGKAVPLTSWREFQATFGGVCWGRQTAQAVYAFFAQGGSYCHVVRGEAPGEETACLVLNGLEVRAASAGDWGNRLAVRITDTLPGQDPAGSSAKPIFRLDVLHAAPSADAEPDLNDRLVARFADKNQLETIEIEGQAYYIVEQFTGLSAALLARPSDPDTPSPLEQRINGSSLFIRVRSPDDATPSRPDNTPTPLMLEGGIGSATATPVDMESALAALEPLGDIRLLVAPETVMIEDPALQRDEDQRVLDFCDNHPGQGLMAVLDAPFGLDPAAMSAFKTGAAIGSSPGGTALRSARGALYYPWIEILAPSGLRNLLIPPAGAMAGLIARTDNAAGPWQAPAGVNYGALSLATGVERMISEADQQALNPDGINAIRVFANFGIVAFGARTLSPDRETVYITVQRTIDLIQVSLVQGLRWLVFEMDSPALRQRVVQDVSAFLTDLWQQGGLMGTTAKDAFWVTCDSSNNPPDSRGEGRLVIDVGVSPTYPAEFVIIRIEQKLMPGFTD